MEPYYQDNYRELYKKDSRDMSELPDESIQCVVTSPPYWGPRTYKGEQAIIWDGDKNCQHEFITQITKHDSLRFRGEHSIVGTDKNRAIHTGNKVNSQSCLKCGARMEAFGLESTPTIYVEHSLQFLDEIYRVLRKDGVAFWNIADVYITGKGSCFNPGGGTKSWASYLHNKERYPTGAMAPNRMFTALPGKNLTLIPERLAVALQEHGWIIRSRIIWQKPNCKPESVKDRPTTDYEIIYMLVKHKHYYWDHEAALIPYTEPLNRWGGPKRKRDTKRILEYDEMMKLGQTSALRLGMNSRPNPKGKNIRTIWSIPTTSGNSTHFAVFPPALPRICIMLATRPNDTVLDPFCGTGTTLYVAGTLGRQSIGYEISEDYCKLTVDKLKQQVLV